jgi:hypothetical protein
LADVVGVPGFASAQRLKLHSLVAGRFANAEGRMYISESLDRDSVNCALFELCSPEIAAPKV